MQKLIFLILALGFLSCKNQKAESVNQTVGEEVKIEYASGFSITEFENYSLLKVNTPWPEAEKPFVYLLYSEKSKIPENIQYDQKVQVPVESIVVTSTTHIPALEALNEENSLAGFPGLDYISSEKTRKIIKSGNISELGQNENINTEVLIDLAPELVIGFAINGSNSSLETIQKTGIPVMYNGDWTENSPLGKAEWIKFFGALFSKKELAASIFEDIKTEYLNAKDLAGKADETPSVIAGSMFRDNWYMPYGNSWQAQFFEDANSNYLYSDTRGEGSLSLAFESVLEKAEDADFWVSSGQFTSYEELISESEHYNRFRSVRNENVYSVSLSKGETGGIIYYELGPQRPDLVLKDLITIFHPGLLKDHEPVFFKPLN
ncbi:ABC transporter substrate-binding protein [Gramella sp. GC03-9]|uniref:ABC transporter substrate-binding protein n=1 Tax=Christiangramia oceanisediminis TaxID=2920386 RepID=A0A9X2R822_9FLAO|nr:ABC transporter substrate-binding protein [Gramella oceanisediminis]MCP9200122.1 ABC transporter substrate-binding protein [Gramella oceanisediminis]